MAWILDWHGRWGSTLLKKKKVVLGQLAVREMLIAQIFIFELWLYKRISFYLGGTYKVLRGLGFESL